MRRHLDLALRATLSLAGLAGLAALAQPAAAATSPSWTPIGPPTGAFQVLPSPTSRTTVYAAADTGAYWSSHDGGLTWSAAGALAVSYPSAVAPDDPATVYTGTPAGLWRSTDGAFTWKKVTALVSAVWIPPSLPRRLYGMATVYTEGAGALFQSEDAGATWSQVGTFPPNFAARSLTLAPDDPDRVYALGLGGFLASADGGATWGEAFDPLTRNDNPVALVLLPASPASPASPGLPAFPATLFFAINRPTAEAGAEIYRSTDGGATWAAADSGLAPAYLLSLAAGPSGTLYATAPASPTTTGVYSSADRGASWQLVAPAVDDNGLAVAAGTPDRLFLSYPHGVELSHDRGRSWSLPARPPSGGTVAQTLLGPTAGGGRLYVQIPVVSDESGSWETADGGDTWRELARNQVFAPQLALDAQPGVIYSISRFVAPSAPQISLDDGATWQNLATPPQPAAQPLGFAADPLQAGKLVVLGCRLSGNFLNPQCLAHGFALTNTLGRGWRLLARLPQGLGGAQAVPSFVRVVPGQPEKAYAGFAGSLLAIAPGGASSPPLVTLPLRGPVVDLLVVPSGAAAPTLYAAALRPRILWKSLDGGAHWSAASPGLPAGTGGTAGGSSGPSAAASPAVPVALALDPLRSSTLYLATRQAIFGSTDAGASWQPMAVDGLPVGIDITTLAAAATPAHALLVGTAGAGVFSLSLP